MAKKITIVGNWKMNPISQPEAVALFRSLRGVTRSLKNVNTIICAPFMYLVELGKRAKDADNYHIGAQDFFIGDVGAHTGQISLGMLKEAGVNYSIIGHSESRAMGETNQDVNAKIKEAIKNEVTPIFCFGEESRGKDKKYLTEIKKQIREGIAGLTQKDTTRIIFAYEPIWAIGAKAKRHCTPDECKEVIDEVRAAMKKKLAAKKAENLVILYGGSADEKTAMGFVDKGCADGVLLGRASLDPRMIGIILRQAEEYNLADR
jgi:triosephosphate isomerase